MNWSFEPTQAEQEREEARRRRLQEIRMGFNSAMKPKFPTEIQMDNWPAYAEYDMIENYRPVPRPKWYRVVKLVKWYIESKQLRKELNVSK